MNEEQLQEELREVKAEMRAAAIPVPAIIPIRRSDPEEEVEGLYVYDFETNVNGRRVKGDSFFEWSDEKQRYMYLGFSLDLGKGSEAPIRAYGFRKAGGYDLTLPEAVNLMEGRSVYRAGATDGEDQGLWISLSREEHPVAGHSLQTHWGPRAEVMADDPRLRRYLIRAERGVLARQLEHGDRVGFAVGRHWPVTPLFVEVEGLEPRLRWTDGQRKEIDWPDISQIKFQELWAPGRGMRR
jgi:hypothetical protein